MSNSDSAKGAMTGSARIDFTSGGQWAYLFVPEQDARDWQESKTCVFGDVYWPNGEHETHVFLPRTAVGVVVIRPHRAWSIFQAARCPADVVAAWGYGEAAKI